MNTRQRTILGVGLVLVAAMCFVPSWQAMVTDRYLPESSAIVFSEHKEAAGHSIVSTPPMNGGRKTGTGGSGSAPSVSE